MKVKVLQTIAGSYGVAKAGDELDLREKDAKELAEKGIVKITGTAGDEGEDFQAKNLTAPKKEVTELKITEKVVKTEAAEKDTDPRNVTGKKPKK